MPLAEALTAQGILPGIKVDTGAKPLAGCRDETLMVYGMLVGISVHGCPFREVASRYPYHGLFT
jgi:hypothetical protein